MVYAPKQITEVTPRAPLFEPGRTSSPEPEIESFGANLVCFAVKNSLTAANPFSRLTPKPRDPERQESGLQQVGQRLQKS